MKAKRLAQIKLAEMEEEITKIFCVKRMKWINSSDAH
jgi:hypothetical protein